MAFTSMDEVQMHEILPLEGILPPETIIEQEDLHHTVAQLPPPLDDFPPLPRESISSPTRSNASIPPLPPLDGFTDEEAERSVTLPLRQSPLRQSSSRSSTSSTASGDSSYSSQSLEEMPAAFPEFFADHTLNPLSNRKRLYQDADLGAFADQSSKRLTPNYSGSLSSTSGDSPEQNSGGDSGEGMGLRRSNSAEELQKLFAFDTEDSLSAMQQEHMEAMRWLEERQEQEQRDAEFARILQENWNDPSHPTTASDSSSLAPALAPGPGPARAPARRSPLGSSSMLMAPDPPPLHMANSFPVDGSNGRLAVSDQWSQPNQIPRQSLATTAVVIDSSDSDVAEIPPPRQFKPNLYTDEFGEDDPFLSEFPWPDFGFQDDAMMSLLTGAPQMNSGFSKSVGFQSSDLEHDPYAKNWYPSNSGPNRTLTASSSTKNPLEDKMTNKGYPTPSASSGYSYGSFSSPYVESGGSSSTASAGGMNSNKSAIMDSLISRYGDYDFMSDPKKTVEEIKELLENIRPDSEMSDESCEGTPEALRYPLMDHQKLGLAWMKSMEEGNNKGGILADDMGLGKTIQALALMVSRPSSDPDRKTTLIVAPVALMQQWKREIERMLRPGVHQRSVFVLHGDRRAVTYKDLKKYDVVLTTFGTLASELKRKEHLDLEGRDRDGNMQAACLPILGPKSVWYRVIIDEAQCIKNRNTKAALACCTINATYRWCMSGTPMMNCVVELHSLLKFLRIRPYCELEKFNTDFTRPLKAASVSGQQRAMQQLQVLLKAVLLRRTKSSKIDGEPILRLPPRVTEEVHAVFSDDEQELYTALESKTQLQFNKYLRAGTIGRNYSNILVLLLRLRQACCHPHLMSDFSVDISASTGEIDLIANAKSFNDDVVQRLKENEPLECPVCIDAVENPIIFFPCGHSTCAECFARISDPALAVQQGNDGSVDVKCPNCRAKVDPKKVTDNASFMKVHSPDDPGLAGGDGGVDHVDGGGDDDDEDDDEDSDQDSLADFIVSDDDVDDDTTGDPDSPRPSATAKKSKKTKGKGKGPRQPTKTLAELKKDAMKNAKAKRKYLNRLQKTWVTSAKVDKVMGLLQGIQNGPLGEKTIIFSQFTSLLDLLEVPIMRKGWDYRRYDGSMRPVDRNNSVTDFTDNPNCKIMLVSLKAGNSGLNLVAASHVVIFDPFWNPYIEEQAIDRAHRIGQMRPVHVHRILVKKTVEDRILALQEKKRELIEGALDEKAGKQVSRLGTRELAYLFGINS